MTAHAIHAMFKTSRNHDAMQKLKPKKKKSCHLIGQLAFLITFMISSHIVSCCESSPKQEAPSRGRAPDATKPTAVVPPCFLHVCDVCVMCVCACRYCSHYENTNLLHELILAVGYFCVLNHDNQASQQKKNINMT